MIGDAPVDLLLREGLLDLLSVFLVMTHLLAVGPRRPSLRSIAIKYRYWLLTPRSLRRQKRIPGRFDTLGCSVLQREHVLSPKAIVTGRAPQIMRTKAHTVNIDSSGTARFYFISRHSFPEEK